SVHPDYQARVWGRMRERLEGKTVPSHYSFKAIRKDSSERWLEMYVIVTEYNGKPAVQATFIDITERQEADIKLQESEARYRGLFDELPVGLYRTSIDGQIIDANPALIKLLGARDIEELLALNASDFYVDRDEREHYEEILGQEGIVTGHDVQFKRLDGEMIWVHDTFRAIRDEDGAVQYYEGSLEDITDQKRAALALKESEEKYRTLVETSPDAITVTDLEGNVIMVNRQALQLYGVEDEKDLIGVSAFELIDPEDVPIAMENLQKTIQTGTSGTMEYTLLRRDGTTYPAELNAAVLKDAEGNPTAFIGVIRDISDRKEAEARYRSLFDSVPVGLYRTTPDGAILDGNPALVKILGFDKKDKLLERNASSFYVDPQARKQWEATIAREDVVTGFQTEFKREDGEIIWVELSVRAIRDVEGNIEFYEGNLEDITDRKRSEEAVRESEAKYRALVDQSLQGIVIFQDGHIVFANPQLMDQLQKTPEDIVGGPPETFWNLIHPEDIEILQQRMQDRAAGEPVPDRYEIRLQRPDGVPMWVEVFVKQIDYQGKPALQVTSIDVTERKLAEQALQESEGKYRNLVEQSLYGIVISQGDPPRIFFANEAFSKMIGYSFEELLALSPKKVQNLIHPSDQEMVLTRVKRRLEGKSAPPQYEYRMVRKDGTVLWVEIFANVIEYEGEPAIQAAYSDITERKKAEAALLESEEKFRALVEDLSDWVWELDLKGTITYSNSAVEDILGFSAGQVLGQTPCDFLRPEDVERAQQTFAELIEKRRPIRTLVIQFVHRDHSDVTLEARGSPVFDENGALIGFRGIFRDITDRLKMLEQLRALDERL
ncbi:MAG: PAS domain S-box protein, partial [Candidatus Hermodarchaeota archaeon]